jgi:serine phosphatase RsbU (regulator of sigma subunit)
MRALALILICVPLFAISQLTPDEEFQIEEYKAVLSSDDHDTIKVQALIKWDGLIYYSDPVQDSTLLQEITKICRNNLKKDIPISEKRFFAKELANGLNYLGSSVTGLGYYKEAIDFFREAIPIYQQAGLSQGLDGCMINLGTALYDNGDMKGAVIQFNNGIKLTDKTGNDQYKANALMSLGNIYLDLGEYDKALDYNKKALNLVIDLDAKTSMEIIYLNMGNAFLYKDQYDSALFCYNTSYQIGIELGGLHTLGTTMNNLGEVHLELGDMDSSLYFYNEGMRIRTELDMQTDLIYSYSGLCTWHTKMKKYNKAIECGKKGLELSQSFKNYGHVMTAGSALYYAYASAGMHKESLETYIIWQSAIDSVQSVENQKEIISQEIQYEYEKNKMADSVSFAKQKEFDDLARAVDKRKGTQEKYILIGGLAFTLLLGGLAFRGYRRKKADNQIISEQKEKAEIQKEQIEGAHKEITDSIAYAKRIQSAILPPKSMVKEFLPDSFILYKPKDVVAGDFYWIEKIEDEIIFAAADCTGHGVPGAMVSVVCNGALNRSVREFKKREPGEILDKARDIVIQEFEKSEEDVKDGMDIALCSLKGKTLKYAGAHNPLWIIRNGEILETKADKQPIGKFEAAKPFTTHEFELEDGDLIYLFSDGFVDQFGGDKGKKFKPRPLRELLLSMKDQSLEKQIGLLDVAFEKWRGDLEQVDDVCMIGVRV